MNRIARNVITLGVAAVIIAATASTPAAASPPSACAELGGTVDTGQICRVHTAGSGYQVTFTFPVGYPDQQALTDYLTQRRQDFISFVAQRPPRDHPYELDATAETFRSGTPSSGTESLVFTV